MRLRPKLIPKQYYEAMTIEFLMPEGTEKNRSKKRWCKHYRKSWPFSIETNRNNLDNAVMLSDAWGEAQLQTTERF